MIDKTVRRPQSAPKTGFYQHYKGPYYEVLDVVRHSETEAWHVLYRTCYGDKGLWVRPLEMFTESVETANGLCPRFAFVGKQLPN
jgi:hypothetical protein